MTRAQPPAPPPRPVRVAALLTGAESVLVLVVSTVYLWDILRGNPQDRGIALFGAALGFGAAAVLAVLARGLLRASRPALAPVVLVQLLMLPVGWSLLQGGQLLPGVVVLGLAVAVLVALFGSTTARESFR